MRKPKPKSATGVVDVAVIGGGITGASAALLLAKKGAEVALIEASEEVPGSAAPDPERLLMLNETSRRLLQDLEVWDALEEVVAVCGIHVWDAKSGGRIDFGPEDAPTGALAWSVPEHLLLRSLWQRLAPLRPVRPGRVGQLHQRGELWQLDLEDGSCISAGLVVGADGSYSGLRKMAGIAVIERDTGQAVVSARIRTEKPHHNTAAQVFSDTGPMGILPRSGDGKDRAIIWSAPVPRAEALMQLSDRDFCFELQRATDGLLGQCTVAGARALMPVVHRTAESLALDGLLLVGEAAGSLHPLAGQGLNLGLADVAALSSWRTGRQKWLRSVGRRRQLEHRLMLAAMEAFLMAFAAEKNRSLLWCRLRGAGMRLFATMPGSRPMLAAFAAGLLPLRTNPYN